MGQLLLLALAVVLAAVVLFLVWSYRKKMAHKAAASQDRYAQLFSASLPGPASGQAVAVVDTSPSGARVLAEPVESKYVP